MASVTVSRRSRPCAQSMLMSYMSMRTHAVLNTISCNMPCHIPGHIPNLSNIAKCECNINLTALNKMCVCLKQLPITLLHLSVKALFNIGHLYFSHELYFYSLLCLPQETTLKSYADDAQTVIDSLPLHNVLLVK